MAQETDKSNIELELVEISIKIAELEERKDALEKKLGMNFLKRVEIELKAVCSDRLRIETQGEGLDATMKISLTDKYKSTFREKS